MALAETENIKPYVGLQFGPVMDNDHSVSSLGTVKTDLGFGVGVMLGYDFGKIRSDIEIMYRKVSLSEIEPNGGSIKISGNLELWTYMLNVTGSLPIDSTIKPFVAVGVGAAEFQAKRTITNTAVAISATDSSAATTTAFAYQGSVGATWQFSPEFSFDALYRYLGTSNFNFKGYTADYGSHNLLFGVRYYFK